MHFLYVLISLFLLSVYCSGQNKINGLWLDTFNRGDSERLDSLMENETDFPLLNPRDLNLWGIDYKDIKNDMLSKVYYYCLTNNREYSTLLNNMEYYYNYNLTNFYYRQGWYAKIFGSNIDNLTKDSDISEQQLLSEKNGKDSIVSLSVRNLSLLRHIIKKRGNVKQYEARRLIYSAGGEEQDWQIEKESLIFFYECLYNNVELFDNASDIELFKPESVLLSCVSVGNLDDECIDYLLRIIDSSKLEVALKRMYPQVGTEEWNCDLFETIPSYENEKRLMSEFSQIEEYCGHNLLHSAIVNVDFGQVKQIVYNNKLLLQKKTKPIHPYFNRIYGDKAYLPLELALFKQKQWQENYESDKIYQTPPYKFRLEQIKKIIDFLKDEE